MDACCKDELIVALRESSATKDSMIACKDQLLMKERAEHQATGKQRDAALEENSALHKQLEALTLQNTRCAPFCARAALNTPRSA